MQEAQIPNYLKAASPEDLRLLMLKNNIEKGVWFKYFDIQFVKNSWYAWYFDKQDAFSEINILRKK